MTGNESGELCKLFPSFPGLCIKTRLSARPLIWRWFFILMQIKLIFTRKVVHFFSLKVSVFGTRKWPNFSPFFFYFRSFMHFLTGVCAIVGGIFTGKARLFVCIFLAVLGCPFSSSTFLWYLIAFCFCSCWSHRLHDLSFLSGASEENRFGKSYLSYLDKCVTQ